MGKPKLFDTKRKQEEAVIVGVVNYQQRLEQAEEYLEELAFLAHTAGAIVKKQFLQKLNYPNPRTFIGEGKLQEISDYVTLHEIDIVIFDDELSPSQLRNLEQQLKCKILDRSNLILDIFASRAQSAQAKYQVELAQAQYLLPRLTRMWTHLSKQKGGIGMKGPGETEIETDRRALREKISKLKERLEVIDRQAATQRRNRDHKARISLVGYTNVGKSTIMNLIAKSDVFAEDKLFATLDSTVRKVDWPDASFLISDTVGFIRKLPHQLVECFKSTLDEIREADILLHVVDISHPNFEDQIHVVNETLKEIGALNKSVVLVFNKIDQLKEPFILGDETIENKQAYLDQLQNSWMAKENYPAIFISASKKLNVEELRNTLTKLVLEFSKKL
ncbi:MAG: GTPase HflX [Bacteroidia bacterium]|nr:GTPase HflX [Bacteroidia bacterium]MCF8426249.1 GTPase HflX [Bacteroidia bacterium]MCF8445454.1 GTPase HflX [Bacteroidia bacterium]